jgi:hypothetical protein
MNAMVFKSLFQKTNSKAADQGEMLAEIQKKCRDSCLAIQYQLPTKVMRTD